MERSCMIIFAERVSIMPLNCLYFVFLMRDLRCWEAFGIRPMDIPRGMKDLLLIG
ncbi:hypothetical protein T231_12785 [Tannerella sp. oral taxon BU063 isolate Cell 6/7/9]|uniref:Uncharacterized protein n=1 Tax=Tannerella sp. oral taxon BU063 isolate Cell 6/7/9 TaxID=1411021 RepID=W2CNC6_9BACT|nr:hypothetical protein T231_12785 [Tannerella sp. oral taxon BU063 isolate Cell 6/7/9]